MIKYINTEPPCGTIIISGGGFEATKLLKYFFPCVVIQFIFVLDGEFIQKFWGDLHVSIVFYFYLNIIGCGTVDITGL